MTVVVTGAAGLLGRHVVEALRSAGHDVCGVDLISAPPGAPPLLRANLTRLGEAVEAIAGADAIVHAAAIPRPVGVTAAEVFRTNVLAAYNVAEAAVLHGARRLVSASSFSVLGLPFNPRPLRPRYLPIDEAHPLAPQEAYALSKLATEEIVAAATRRSDLTAVSLRMPWIQTPASFALDVAPRRGDPTIAAANLWSYIDVRDAAAAFLAALECSLVGHAAVYISAPDTFMEEATLELVEIAFGEIELRSPLLGHAPVLDTAASEGLLGIRAVHSWRSYHETGE
jgi:nucleoside-diphosphate-sugar epimerase